MSKLAFKENICLVHLKTYKREVKKIKKSKKRHKRKDIKGNFNNHEQCDIPLSQQLTKDNICKAKKKSHCLDEDFNKFNFTFNNLAMCKLALNEQHNHLNVQSTSTCDFSPKKQGINSHFFGNSVQMGYDPWFYMCIRPVHENSHKNERGDMIEYGNYESSCLKQKIIPPQLANMIYRNMISEEYEKHEACIYGYMDHQSDINQTMRAILIDWLVQVHSSLGFTNETLFLTVGIIDEYLSIHHNYEKNNLQLLGISSMLISSKVLDIPPQLQVIENLAVGLYSKEEILRTEQKIVFKLSFLLKSPTVPVMYDILSLNFGFSEKDYIHGRYMLELTLLNYEFLKYKQSVIVCSVTYLVMKFNQEKFKEYYFKIFAYSSGNEKTIKECAKEVCFIIENIGKSEFTSIPAKYSSKEFYEVSSILLQK